ncbi:hypothetical protein BGX33_010187 [Mortierella sp. NVP41]|nr:hypothetical protein BGX33_010187 [Mortierella sp. NVP41]
MDWVDNQDSEEDPGMVDQLTSRRMRILIREKPWHDYLDPSAASNNIDISELSSWDQMELQVFREQQGDIQRRMSNEALNRWKEWCSVQMYQPGTAKSLKNLIDYIGNKIIPHENSVLRQFADHDLIPVSGTEALLLPLLRHWYQEEEKAKEATRTTSHSHPSPSPSTGLILKIRTRPLISPSMSLPNSHNLLASSQSGSTGYITFVDQMATKIDSETEEEGEEEVSPWIAIKPIRERTPETAVSSSAVLDDGSCLEDALEIVHTIAMEVESFDSSIDIDYAGSNPYLLTDSFFARLRKDQVKGKRLGLDGTLFNPLLVDALKEHVQLIQTLFIQMSNRVISLVPTSKVKGSATSRISAATDSLMPNSPQQVSRPINMPFSSILKTGIHGGEVKTAEQNKDGLKLQSDATEQAVMRQDISGTILEQETKVKEQTPVPHRDIEMQARLLSVTAPSADAKPSLDTVPQDRMVKDGDDSVRQAWQSWKFGEKGVPALQELVSRYGSAEMDLRLRNYCTKAYYLSSEIERLCGEGMKVDTAIQSLEARRHLSLDTLAMVICQERTARDRKGGGGKLQGIGEISSGFLDLATGLSPDFSSATAEMRASDCAIALSSEYPGQPPSGLDTPILTPVTADPGASSGSRVVQRPIAPDSRPNDLSTSQAQLATGILDDVSRVIALTTTPVIIPIAATKATTPAPVDPLSSPDMPIDSLRSTFKALAALNTQSSTLGSSFTQRRRASTNLPTGGQQVVTGSLPAIPVAATSGISQSITTVPLARTIPTATPLQGTSVTQQPAVHQSVPPPEVGPGDSAATFRLDIELQTVYDIWDLWISGLRGSPSVADLIKQHGTKWLHPADREVYRDLRSVLLTLERSVRLKRIDVRTGLTYLEQVRIQFKLPIQRFSRILSAIEMGLVPGGSDLSRTLLSEQSPTIMTAFAAAIATITSSQSSMTPSQ